jgi:hypothetical protein
MIYAGIGARDTPDSVLTQMYAAGRYFAGRSVTLRSGGALGADAAFERGCSDGFGRKEIFLPFLNFNRNESLRYRPSKEARAHAMLFHPNWLALSCRGRDFMARNSEIILGADLKTPVDFVMCWTQGGEIIGGTGQGLRIANHYRIPIFNLGSMDTHVVREKVLELLSKG